MLCSQAPALTALDCKEHARLSATPHPLPLFQHPQSHVVPLPHVAIHPRVSLAPDGAPARPHPHPLVSSPLSSSPIRHTPAPCLPPPSSLPVPLCAAPPPACPRPLGLRPLPMPAPPHLRALALSLALPTLSCASRCVAPHTLLRPSLLAFTLSLSSRAPSPLTPPSILPSRSADLHTARPVCPPPAHPQAEAFMRLGTPDYCSLSMTGVSTLHALQLEPLEAAQVQMAMAQAANALFKMYLMAVGTDPSESSVNREEVCGHACLAVAWTHSRSHAVPGRAEKGTGGGGGGGGRAVATSALRNMHGRVAEASRGRRTVQWKEQEETVRA